MSENDTHNPSDDLIRMALSDKISFEEMIELATNATYQLAKRQITWLKKFDLDETFFSDDDDKVMKILSIIKN